jgi:hypothetical protein
MAVTASPFEAMYMPTLVLLLLISCLFTLYFCYRKLLPQPIPGIPCNRSAVTSLLGDIPDMVRSVNQTGEIWPWVTEQIVKHQSPIVQMFARPFSRPWVAIADHRETVDILTRRLQDFDRSHFAFDVFGGVAPDLHIPFKTTDPKFKEHRHLLRDLMTPAFLHDTAVPQIYAHTVEFVDMWTKKAKLARGHAFQADEDINDAALDTIFAVSFSLRTTDSTTHAHLTELMELKELELSEAMELPVNFPHSNRPEDFVAIKTLIESIATSMNSPVPRLAHWMLRHLPYMRAARARKENLIRIRVEDSAQRLAAGNPRQNSALDNILQRESLAAEKDGRQPDFHSRAVYDEASIELSTKSSRG